MIAVAAGAQVVAVDVSRAAPAAAVELSNEIGKVASSTEVYGVDGDYYIDVVADGAWKITIQAQT
jgi:capsular polysaccharide biosynthesis protein